MEEVICTRTAKISLTALAELTLPALSSVERNDMITLSTITRLGRNRSLEGEVGLQALRS